MRASKGILSAILSVVLAFGLVPASAFAQEASGLAVASPVAPLATQAKKKLSNAQKKRMKAAYKKVLKRAMAGGSAGGVGMGGEYAMFDMGADGIPELFVKTSDPSWGGSFHVFDFSSGKARHLGICYLSDGWLYGTRRGKLYLSSGRQGAYSVSPVVKSNGKVTTRHDKGKSFIAKDLNDWDRSWRRCSAYVKRLGATALSTSPVMNYSLLNSKVKASTVSTAAAKKKTRRASTLTAYKQFLAGERVAYGDGIRTPAMGYASLFEVDEFAIADLNRDGVKELVTYGGGKMMYTKVFVYRAGKIGQVICTTTITPYSNGVIKRGFGSGSGDWTETYCRITKSGKIKPVKRGARFMANARELSLKSFNNTASNRKKAIG